MVLFLRTPCIISQIREKISSLIQSQGEELNENTAIVLTKDNQTSLITSWSGQLQQNDGNIGIGDVFARRNGIENDSQVNITKLYYTTHIHLFQLKHILKSIEFEKKTEKTLLNSNKTFRPLSV